MNLPRRRHILTVLIGVTGACAATACGGQVDLADLIVDANVYTETAEIDLGDSTIRNHLLEGWSPLDERWLGREEETFVWALAGGAAAELWWLQTVDRPLAVRFRPNSRDDDLLFRELYVTVNGGPLPPVPVQPGWQEIEFQVPGRYQIVGPNRIAFGYDRPPGTPAADSNPETYRIAVDWIRSGNVMVTALPRQALGAGSELLLPHLSVLDLRLTAGPGASLHLGRVREYGLPLGGAPNLVVRTESAAGVSIVELTIPDDRFIDPEPIRLSVDAAAPVRLTLMVVPPAPYRLLEGHRAEQDSGVGLLGASLSGVSR